MGMGKNAFKKKESNRIPVKFNIGTLNAILGYVYYSEKYGVKRGDLLNAKRLFEMVDNTLYIDNINLEARVYWIRQSLRAKLDLKISKKSLIFDFCRNDKYTELEDVILEDITENKNLTPDEVKHISKDIILDRLNNGFILLYMDTIIKLFTKLQTGDYLNLGKSVTEIKDVMSCILSEIRKAETLHDINNVPFTLEDGIFEEIINNTIDSLVSTSNLKCGMQGLNDMIGGAFEPGRIYTFFAASGGFKSGLLLNLLYQLKVNNRNYKLKDKTKKPVILLINQENGTYETVNRLFSLVAGEDVNDRLRNYKDNKEEAVQRMRQKLYVDEENNIDIMVKYVKGRTITTEDINFMIDDIEEQGYEVVCLLHDYIMQLRSANRTNDIRIELGEIVNELKAIAIDRNIPILTASQLNRDAAKKIDEAIASGIVDIAKHLDRSNVGESWAQVSNSDFAIILNREISVKDNARYLTFKLIKGRGEENELVYFNQPFDTNHTMRLIQDIDKVKAYKISLASDLIEDSKIINLYGRQNAKPRKEINDVEEEEAFNFSDGQSLIEYMKNKRAS